MEYITTKLYKKTKEAILFVQAQHQLEKGVRESEAEIVDEVFEHYVEEVYAEKKKAKYKFSDLIGSIKTGKRSHPDEIDNVVYEL